MHTNGHDNTELIMLRQAVQGDHAAWEWLFQLHFQPVYYYCLSLVRGDEEGAEELTQDVFVTAALRLYRYREDRGSFRCWLLGVARYRSLKQKQRQKRRWQREVSLTEVSPTLESKHQRWLCVYEILGQLPTHYRLVLEAKYIECLSVQEIAEREQSTAKAIESLLTRARLRFRKLYKKADE